MNESLIIKLYTQDRLSLRAIAEKLNTNHKLIGRILSRSGVVLNNKNRERKPFTSEHKRKLSETSKGRVSSMKGKKVTKTAVYKNMICHIRFDISYEWLINFEDIEKLKTLNRAISNRDGRWKDIDTAKYISYIEKFYNDKDFNKIYNQFKQTKNKWLRPSIDHIIPIAKGGTNDLNNLCFMTWFENRCKSNIDNTEWKEIKNNIHKYINFNESNNN